MKIVDNFYHRQNSKLKSALKFKNRETAKLYEDCRNYEIEKRRITKEYEDKIQQLEAFYKNEITSITTREKNIWQAGTEERDAKIKDLQKKIDDNSKFFDFLKERDEAFKEMMSSISGKFQTAANLNHEISQYSLAAEQKYESYTRKYLTSEEKK